MSDIIGFLIIYIGIIVIVPYLLLKFAPFSVFITWFANVDIVANILSINFPQYFKQAYNINPSTLTQYLSYNAISLVALSGIFIHGLRTHDRNKLKTLVTMIIMSIVTWTLPTQGIPYMNNKIDAYIRSRNQNMSNKEFKQEKIIITMLISLLFVFIEWLIIHFIVDAIDFDLKLPKLLSDLL